MGSVGAKEVPVLLSPEGLRIDGRKLDELRPIHIQVGALHNADGSAFVEWGANKVMAAVYGPREVHPRHLQQNNKAVIQCKYNMAAFSVDEPSGPGSTAALRNLQGDRGGLRVGRFRRGIPRTSIDIYIEVLQANAGTRCAGLVAASLALADAGIPMVDLLPSVAVGKIAGKIALDLKKEEDNFGEADLPMALVPQSGRLVLLQMEGHMTEPELSQALELGVQGCREIYEKMKQALRERYSTGPGGGSA